MVFCDTSMVAKLYVVETEARAVRAMLEEADQRKRNSACVKCIPL